MKAIMTQSLFGSAQFNMFQILLFFGILVNANAQTVWTYNNQNGWPNDKCKSGSKQSPIEINPQKTDFEMSVMDPFLGRPPELTHSRRLALPQLVLVLQAAHRRPFRRIPHV